MRTWMRAGDIRRAVAIVALVIVDALLFNALLRVKTHRLYENGLHSKYDMK